MCHWWLQIMAFSGTVIWWIRHSDALLKPVSLSFYLSDLRKKQWKKTKRQVLCMNFYDMHWSLILFCDVHLGYSSTASCIIRCYPFEREWPSHWSSRRWHVYVAQTVVGGREMVRRRRIWNGVLRISGTEVALFGVWFPCMVAPH